MSETPPNYWVRARFEHAPRQVRDTADVAGTLLTDGFHLLGLFAIGAATVWSAVVAYMHMMERGAASIEDLLLLFIYLEIGAMVGIYFKTNRLPIRFLIYVALTALTRHLIGSINATTHHGTSSGSPSLEWNVVILSSAITLLAFAVLLLRYGSHYFPSEASSAYETDLKAQGNGTSESGI